MRVGSLFSGIGGLDLGLERAGMEIVWQVENDPYCQKVLKKHWPEVPCYGDIKEVDFTKLPAVDLICGGFPCQPWSIAGAQKGVDDERNLWTETFRAIRETQARWVLLENVPNLLTHEYFGRIIGELSSHGYIVEWYIIPASAFGFLHKRERLFIVAYSKGIGCTDAKYGSDKSYIKWDFLASVSTAGSNPNFKTKYAPPSLYEELMGFPLGWTELKPSEMLWSPQVAEWIGRRIMEVIGEDATL